ncbi:MAG: hypothetical protein Ta2A_07600 [Treponemataceae bacterium]|nr:MAG: hypothetical protein Ta2A_07600 [Treponemataceae bacterium]
MAYLIHDWKNARMLFETDSRPTNMTQEELTVYQLKMETISFRDTYDKNVREVIDTERALTGKVMTAFYGGNTGVWTKGLRGEKVGGWYNRVLRHIDKHGVTNLPDPKISPGSFRIDAYGAHKKVVKRNGEVHYKPQYDYAHKKVHVMKQEIFAP